MRASLSPLIEAWAEDLVVATIPRSSKLGLRRGTRLSRRIREGRFQQALSFVAGASALLAGIEVTLEHYRGSYGQRVMYTPVALSAPLAAAGFGAVWSPRIAETVLPWSSVLMLADAAAGFVYHVRGVARKPGGWRLPVFNVVMGPPLFAPLLLGIGGFLGLIASGLRREDERSGLRALLHRRPRGWTARRLDAFSRDLRRGRFQNVMAWATAISAVLNGMEALASHHRNGFRHASEWIPVLSAPAIAAAGAGAVFSERVSNTVLPLVSAGAIAIGGIGFYQHVRGVMRRPGNPRHVLYNIVYGPPPIAPLLFAATGFLGLLASQLRRRR